MGGGSSSRRVFICYRRDDSSAAAARLAEALEVEFPGGVFIDANLEPASLWDEGLEAEIARSHVVLVLIAHQWLHLQNKRSGKRRLDEDEDVVRREIELALAWKDVTRILPVMVDGAEGPAPEHLPESIRKLVAHQKARLRTSPNGDWKADVGQLVSFIRAIPIAAPVPSPADAAAPATLASEHSLLPSWTPLGQTVAAIEAGAAPSRPPRPHRLTMVAAGVVAIATLIVPRVMSLWPDVERPPPLAQPATRGPAGDPKHANREEPAEPAAPPATPPDAPVATQPSPPPEATPTSATVRERRRSTDGAAGTGARQTRTPSQPPVEPSPADTGRTDPPSAPDAATQPPWVVRVFHPGCESCVWPAGTAVRLQIDGEDGSMTEPVDSEGKARFALTQERGLHKGRITLVDAGLCEGSLQPVSLNESLALEARRKGDVAACYDERGKRCPCMKMEPCSKQCVTGAAP